MKKNTQRNQGYLPAASPLAQSSTLPFDFDPSSDEEPPAVNRDGNFEDANESPSPEANPAASYTESLMSRIKDAADSVKRGARNVFVAGLGTLPTRIVKKLAEYPLTGIAISSALADSVAHGQPYRENLFDPIFFAQQLTLNLELASIARVLGDTKFVPDLPELTTDDYSRRIYADL